MPRAPPGSPSLRSDVLSHLRRSSRTLDVLFPFNSLPIDRVQIVSNGGLSRSNDFWISGTVHTDI